MNHTFCSDLNPHQWLYFWTIHRGEVQNTTVNQNGAYKFFVTIFIVVKSLLRYKIIVIFFWVCTDCFSKLFESFDDGQHMMNVNIKYKFDINIIKKRKIHFYILIIWESIGFMWKMTFEIFIKSLRFETPHLWPKRLPFSSLQYIFCLLKFLICFLEHCILMKNYDPMPI